MDCALACRVVVDGRSRTSCHRRRCFNIHLWGGGNTEKSDQKPGQQPLVSGGPRWGTQVDPRAPRPHEAGVQQDGVQQDGVQAPGLPRIRAIDMLRGG